ncbi:helix-turn-helix domain-containing protein [Hymenobacter sp. HDW8]|uniref:helix-turn-helix domain-containing protein n=1 Tax=Hymenobacter sp. HDW8 TaxID=2714932 RepID=UPI00140D9468|nr:helix-turn-helix transcriptional regulator [Hymenobacter sp. HDW8]QIL77761.1 helix-turn-helix transcriptional regulator [Hymenobacter sp. HDW8]
MFFEFSPYSSLLLPFFVQGVVFIGILLVRGWQRGLASDWWLALLLLLNTLPLTQWMLGFAGWYDSHDAHSTFMFYFPFSHWLALGPTFYFYFRSLTNQDFRFGKAEKLHFLPAAVYLGWRLMVFGHDVVWQHWSLGEPFTEHFGTKGNLANVSEVLDGTVELLGYLSVFAYGWLTLRDYQRYRRYLDDNYSNTGPISFQWLRNLMVAVLVGLLVSFFFGLVNKVLTPLSYIQVWYSFLATGLLIYYLGIAGLLAPYQPAPALHFQPTSTEDVQATTSTVADRISIEALEPAGLESKFEKKPQASAPVAELVTAEVAPDPDLTRWATKLSRHMETERPYLAPELTLSELASQLRTNTSLLSRVINTYFGQNFNDYINRYRIAEAERKLQDPRFQHYTLLAVALESGFNSKSTFNRVFKKLKSATPSEVAARLNP